MSLIDSLLLDPYPLNIYTAARTDGVKGSGTINDPYDGGTQYGNPIQVTALSKSVGDVYEANATTNTNRGYSNGDLNSGSSATTSSTRPR